MKRGDFLKSTASVVVAVPLLAAPLAAEAAAAASPPELGILSYWRVYPTNMTLLLCPSPNAAWYAEDFKLPGPTSGCTEDLRSKARR